MDHQVSPDPEELQLQRRRLGVRAPRLVQPSRLCFRRTVALPKQEKPGIFAFARTMGTTGAMQTV